MRGKKPCQVNVYSHFHRTLHDTVRIEGHVCEAFITPSWAARTPHGKNASREEELADIGGLIVRVEKGKVLEAFFDMYQYEDSPEVYV